MTTVINSINTNIISGIFFSVYSGYMSDNPNYFSINSLITIGTIGTDPNKLNQGYITKIPDILIGTNNFILSTNTTNYSVQWVGYFKSNYTGNWTFYTESDDCSYLWIGQNALSGYTTSNALINNGGQHSVQKISGTILLNDGIYYPIRIQFGSMGSGQTMSVSFSNQNLIETTDGTNYYYYTYNSVLNNIGNPLMVSGIKPPKFGTSSTTWTSTTNNLPTNTGYNLIVSNTEDDANFTANMMFQYYIGGTRTTTIWPCSNTYVVFGNTGSIAYDNLSASNPSYPKFMFGAADNSWQRVWTLSTTNYWRCRYEGTASTGGTPGSSNIIIEYTFFNPILFSGNMICELLVGTNARTSGVFMVANSTTNLGTSTLTQNNSYVFVGNSTGTSWTVNNGYYIKNSGY